MSALADELGDPQDYAVGLWLLDLARGLCWRKRTTGIDRSITVTEYYAASWSWYSVRANIYQGPPGKEDNRFRLLAYNSELAHPSAPFGYKYHASLCVEDRCGSASLFAHRGLKTRTTIEFTPNPSQADCNVRDNSLHVNIDIDCVDLIIVGNPVPICLLVLLVDEDEIPNSGIILVRATLATNEQKETYYRVGTFTDNHYWKHGTESGEHLSDKYKNNKEHECEMCRFKRWLQQLPVES